VRFLSSPEKLTAGQSHCASNLTAKQYNSPQANITEKSTPRVLFSWQRYNSLIQNRGCIFERGVADYYGVVALFLKGVSYIKQILETVV
jgi:hypothetical protein